MNLIIKTNPSNWDDSLIVAAGLAKDGLALSSAATQITAAALPEEYLEIWHGIVEQLKAGGDGQVVCVMATASIVEKTGDDGSGESLVKTVELETLWQYPDGRMLPPQTAMLPDDAALDLVEFLLTAEAYEQ